MTPASDVLLILFLFDMNKEIGDVERLAKHYLKKILSWVCICLFTNVPLQHKRLSRGSHF